MDSRALWILLVFANILLADADNPAIDAIFLRLFKKNGTYIDKNIKNATQLIAYIDTTLETSLFISGWGETINSEDVHLITGAFLQATDDNVLAVDYRELVNGSYITSVLNVVPTGKAIANSLNSMFDAGLNPMKLHIIGHSLGAHVAGNVGRNLKVKIPRITALDAAGPLFLVGSPHLKPTDAQFVDAIHTDSGVYGTIALVGTVNFFPDFGIEPQPGCPVSEYLSYCNHERSFKLYAETVKHPKLFVARKCDNATSFRLSLCNNNKQTTLMGYGTPSDVKGSYYLTTSANIPYGLGLKGSVYDN